MKRFLILLSLLFCNVVFADTINLHWLNEDGSIYQNSTCVIDSDLILPATPPTKYGYTFTGWKLASYIPIEYLESTGTQYIDTEYQGNLYTKISVTFSATVASSDHNSAIIAGNLIDRTKAISMIFPLQGRSRTCRFGNKEFDIPDNTGFLNTTYTIETNKNCLKIDGRTINCFNTTTDFQTSGTLFLFDLAPIGAARTGSIRIYNCQIYYNDSLIRDFIPVLDYNNIPCMYDRVESKFYYNQGTGQFIAGPVLQ